jgi:hypothetical protein
MIWWEDIFIENAGSTTAQNLAEYMFDYTALRMNEWMNKWMDEGMNSWMDKRTKKWITEQWKS